MRNGAFVGLLLGLWFAGVARAAAPSETTTAAFDVSSTVLRLARAAGANVVLGRDVGGEVRADLAGLEPLEALRRFVAASRCNLVEVPGLPLTFVVAHRLVADVRLPAPRAGAPFTLSPERLDMRDVFAAAARAARVSCLFSTHVGGVVSVEVRDVPPLAVLALVAAANGLTFTPVEVRGLKGPRTVCVVTAAPFRAPDLVPELQQFGITLKVRQLELRDVFRAIARQARLNVVFAPEVRGAVAVELVDVPPLAALRLLAAVNRFEAAPLPWLPNGWLVRHPRHRPDRPFDPGLAPEEPADFSVVSHATPLADLVEQVARHAGLRVVVDRSVTGQAAVELKDVRPRAALRALCSAHELSVVPVEGAAGLWLVSQGR